MKLNFHSLVHLTEKIKLVPIEMTHLICCIKGYFLLIVFCQITKLVTFSN